MEGKTLTLIKEHFGVMFLKMETESADRGSHVRVFNECGGQSKSILQLFRVRSDDGTHGAEDVIDVRGEVGRRNTSSCVLK